MFANMQRITVAFLVVAFVLATVPAVPMRGPRYNFVLDLYSGIDHKFIGSFSLQQSSSLRDMVIVWVDQPFNFSSEYHNVFAHVYGYKNVAPGCAPDEDGMLDSNNESTLIYDGGALELSRSNGFRCSLSASLTSDGEQSILGRIVIMFAQKQKNTEHSAIACGRIRQANSTDYFLEELNRMPTLPPVSLSTKPEPLTLRLKAFAPLVLVKDVAKEGFMVFFDTTEETVVLVGLKAPMVASWNEGTAVAVLYRSEDVTPTCVTTGAASGVHDANRNRTRPAILFKSRFEDHLGTYYTTYVDCELVSPKSDCDIMGRVVVLYILQSESPTVLDDFLQPTNPHTPIACGLIWPRELFVEQLLPDNYFELDE